MTAKKRDQLRNPTLGNRAWTTFTLVIKPLFQLEAKILVLVSRTWSLGLDLGHEGLVSLNIPSLFNVFDYCSVLKKRPNTNSKHLGRATL